MQPTANAFTFKLKNSSTRSKCKACGAYLTTREVDIERMCRSCGAYLDIHGVEEEPIPSTTVI